MSDKKLQEKKWYTVYLRQEERQSRVLEKSVEVFAPSPEEAEDLALKLADDDFDSHGIYFENDEPGEIEVAKVFRSKEKHDADDVVEQEEALKV